MSDASQDSLTWVKAGAADNFPSGSSRRIDIQPPIAVFNVEGAFLAIDDTCTHGLSSLSEGYVDGDVVECAWHMARFCLRTGRALCLPATVGVRAYETAVRNGEVMVAIPHDRGMPALGGV